jgi:tetratricopeptide (TPR) repeat protein
MVARFSTMANPADSVKISKVGNIATPGQSLENSEKQAEKYQFQNPRKSLKYAFEALEVIRKEKPDATFAAREAHLYNLAGRIYERSGLLEVAMEYYLKSMFIYQTIPDSSAAIWGLVDVGNIFLSLGSPDKAVEYYSQALKYFAKREDEYGMATMFNNLALVHSSQGNTDSALVLFSKALKIRQESNNDTLVAHSLTYIGGVKEAQGLPDSAVIYYSKAYQIYHNLQLRSGMAQMRFLIGGALYRTGRTKEAIIYLQESVWLFGEVKNIHGLAPAYEALATVLASQADYRQSVTFTDSMLVAASQLGSTKLVALAHKKLAGYYEKLGNLPKTIENLKRYNELLDSLARNEISGTSNKYELLIDYQQRNREIMEMKQREQKDIFFKYTLLIILVLIVVIAVLVLSRQLILNRKNREIIRKNSEIAFAQEALVKVQQNELSNYALYIARRNELMHDIREKLRNMHKSPDVERKALINELLLMVGTRTKIDAEVQRFKEKIEQECAVFFSRLSEKYPNMTQSEKELVAMLRLNLTSKEIALLNNVTEKGVEMARYRLRKKLGLDSEVNFNEYFKKLEY